MRQEPLVSLILCVKDGMPFLPSAVRSVARQSYRNFELIVQDGGSGDGTLEYLRNVSDVARIDIRSEPDSGIGQAYNRAVRRCSGEIIGSIDADNVLEDHALDTIVAYWRERPDAAAMYGGSTIIDADGMDIQRILPAPFDLIRLLWCELVPPFASAFFSTEACGEALRFDEALRTCADFDLWLRLGHLPIDRIESFLSRTRISSKSMTRNVSRYEPFCADKISALANFRSAHGPGPDALIDRLFAKARASVYLWAAESVYELEGDSDAFRHWCAEAATLDGESDRLKRLEGEAPSGSDRGRGTVAVVFKPAGAAVVGQTVSITVAVDGLPGEVAAIQAAVNVAADGSANGDWIILGTQPIKDGVGLAVFEWPTAGGAPGEHRVGVNVTLAEGQTLWWYEQRPRVYVLDRAHDE